MKKVIGVMIFFFLAMTFGGGLSAMIFSSICGGGVSETYLYPIYGGIVLLAGLIVICLEIKKAHICGASMGAMIAQVFAYRHPSRICSLISIMSSTGNPNNPQISPETLAIVTATPPSRRDAYIDHTLRIWKKIWSKGFPFEEERAMRYCEESYDRSYYPQGAVRQNAALVANGDRRQHLFLLTIPALVIHGTADVLFPVEAGKDTARTIPNAKLLLIEGMGHDMPTGTWKSIVEAIVSQVKELSIYEKKLDSNYNISNGSDVVHE